MIVRSETSDESAGRWIYHFALRNEKFDPFWQSAARLSTFCFIVQMSSLPNSFHRQHDESNQGTDEHEVEQTHDVPDFQTDSRGILVWTRYLLSEVKSGIWGSCSISLTLNY